MTTKEWLNRGRDLDKEIRALEQVRYEAYCACVSRTSRSKQDIIMTDKNPNAKLERLAELNRLIDNRIDELIDTKEEILAAICQVENATYRTLLIERYVNFKDWKQIAERLGKNESTVRGRLHGNALKTCTTYCATGHNA